MHRRGAPGAGLDRRTERRPQTSRRRDAQALAAGPPRPRSALALRHRARAAQLPVRGHRSRARQPRCRRTDPRLRHRARRPHAVDDLGRAAEPARHGPGGGRGGGRGDLPRLRPPHRRHPRRRGVRVDRGRRCGGVIGRHACGHGRAALRRASRRAARDRRGSAVRGAGGARQSDRHAPRRPGALRARGLAPLRAGADRRDGARARTVGVPGGRAGGIRRCHEVDDGGGGGGAGAAGLRRTDRGEWGSLAAALAALLVAFVALAALSWTHTAAAPKPP